jgi:proline iminopeptidase
VTERFPPIEPYETGFLDVGDGHRIYWETCGNPDGKPAVVIHGGPGSGCGPGMRRYFDPDRYRIVLFDQRNCGRSTPHASADTIDLSTNTTAHLIADMETLREHLGIDKWLLWGGSWGSILGIVYAETHPERVSEIVMMSVVAGSNEEVDWVTRDMGRVFPREWERFRDGVPESDRAANLPAAYSRLLHDADRNVRDKAARDWCDWEDTHVSVLGPDPHPQFADPRFRLAFARLVTHYWANDHFLDGNDTIDGCYLLRHADRLGGIPGVLAHGMVDVSGPPDIPWRLAKLWPEAELHLIPQAGHGNSAPDMVTVLIDATNRFAER